MLLLVVIARHRIADRPQKILLALACRRLLSSHLSTNGLVGRLVGLALHPALLLGLELLLDLQSLAHLLAHHVAAALGRCSLAGLLACDKSLKRIDLSDQRPLFGRVLSDLCSEAGDLTVDGAGVALVGLGRHRILLLCLEVCEPGLQRWQQLPNDLQPLLLRPHMSYLLLQHLITVLLHDGRLLALLIRRPAVVGGRPWHYLPAEVSNVGVCCVDVVLVIREVLELRHTGTISVPVSRSHGEGVLKVMELGAAYAAHVQLEQRQSLLLCPLPPPERIH
mmetsp:Transcript_36737/g.105322  ORF Transcript_36737/g.105322 Transcript_36737/m.105322 type:complete len:279 (-) Transcript_36737:855-1691(-)